MSIKEILVVDDEIGIRELLSDILFDEGYRVYLAENADQARKMVLNSRPDLVLLDIWMPKTDGLTLLKEWAAQMLLTMPVIMMSGHGTIETALEATRIGAVDFLEKPIALQKLLKAVTSALQKGMLPISSIQENKAEEKLENGMVMLPLPLDLPLREAREYFDSAYLKYQIQKENGNITRLAEKVGLERTHLYRKLKQLGIKPNKKGDDNTE